jgi:hypothetical protein
MKVTFPKGMQCPIGKTLAHYKITSQLGKSGMGEVYQAKDQKRGREVGIKVLPEEFAKDADRVARFQREAKLLASLNLIFARTMPEEGIEKPLQRPKRCPSGYSGGFDWSEWSDCATSGCSGTPCECKKDGHMGCSNSSPHCHCSGRGPESQTNGTSLGCAL